MAKRTPRWIAVDPGEDTGFSVWEGNRLIVARTIKLWTVAHLMDAVLEQDRHKIETLYPEVLDVYDELAGRPLERFVVEDWRIYPWEARNLAWDQCRTARLIGCLTFLAQKHEIKFVLQGAKIKETAVAAGAELLFYHPLHENRHMNDSIMHGVHYLVIEEGTAAVDGR